MCIIITIEHCVWMYTVTTAGKNIMLAGKSFIAKYSGRSRIIERGFLKVGIAETEIRTVHQQFLRF